MSRTTTAACIAPVELRLPAHPVELKAARELVGAAADEFGFGPKGRYDLVFAVNEAVTNAIKHGGPDADGMISLAIEADGDALVCTVTDSGPFVPAGSEPATDTDESGRGFMFMSALTDEFELVLQADATVVRLRKVLSDEGPVADA